jgi:hypothetical protein
MSELLEKDRAWNWGPAQKAAFDKVKELVTKAPTLVFYDVTKKTVVSADASSYGIGGVLLQEHNGMMKPVAFCSRTLTKAERRYAQIEKECLSCVWACERFSRYLVGLENFQIQTDHKPLVPLINVRDLDETPLRCQRMLTRLMRFNAKAEYTPGKFMYVADTLSRSPLQNDTVPDDMEDEVATYVCHVRASWPVTDAKLNMIREETQKDVNLKYAMEYTIDGWPTYKQDVKLAARDFFAVRGELSVWNGLLLRGERIVIPYSLRGDLLERIHDGHMGIVKCRERAAMSVWWPKISADIKEKVAKCRFCLEKQPTQKKEPLMPTPMPERPFQRVAADICEQKGDSYLVTMDYYSKYIDIAYLPRLTSAIVIDKLKGIFAHHGIPEVLVTDNGMQFASDAFAMFAKEWNFVHETSSPTYPQSNGQAESGVKIAKPILAQPDPFLALLSYRATPIPTLEKSPAELAHGRKIRTTLPLLPSALMPYTVNHETVRQRGEAAKQNQKFYFDKQHGARPLSELQPGNKVLIKNDKEKKWNGPAEVIRQVAPRSYLLQTTNGRIRRNRRHIKLCPAATSSPPVTIHRFPPSPRQNQGVTLPSLEAQHVPRQPPTFPRQPPSPRRPPTSPRQPPMSPRGPPRGPPIPRASPTPVQALPQAAPSFAQSPPPEGTYKTRSGRNVVPPARFQVSR